MVACDPGMCAALESLGVTPGRLVLLQRPGAARLLGPGIIVAALSIPIRLAHEYAPALIASFGSGSARVDVRETVPGGTAAYASALRADLAARMSAGSQLLQNGRITFTAQAAAQLRAGAVDSRLLVTLAAMSSQYSIRVTGFGDTSPGAQVLFRAVVITRGGRSAGTAGLTAALDMVNAQGSPYRPARASIIHPATGSAALLIEFAAPSPLGLLTPVLTVHTQGAEAHTTVIAGAFPDTGIAQMRGK
ncbi:MAG: hypothetical protein M3Y33_12040, partial [Actinomycetota bacterium]|nr:hypothetical protein [Actinomycetota bacterium]